MSEDRKNFQLSMGDLEKAKERVIKAALAHHASPTVECEMALHDACHDTMGIMDGSIQHTENSETDKDASCPSVCNMQTD